MNKRNLEIFGWRDIELKLEHVILFIIFLIVLSLIIYYFFKDSKDDIEGIIQQRINETKQITSQPVQIQLEQNKTEVIQQEREGLSEYEVLNWDTSSFSSVCKQDYGRYRDDINDINSQVNELEPDLDAAKKQLEEIEYKINDLKLQLEKRNTQLRHTVEQCRK